MPASRARDRKRTASTVIRAAALYNGLVSTQGGSETIRQLRTIFDEQGSSASLNFAHFNETLEITGS